MSDIIKVDTERLMNIAKKIDCINKDILQEYQSVEKAISSLNSKWESKVTTDAISAFYDISNNCKEFRYNVVNDYVNFLQQQVIEGYNQTETVNTTLADRFK